jgi:thioredoxin 1
MSSIYWPTFEYKGIPMSEHVTTISDAVFETEVMQSDVPVIVDFWAEWCLPCKTLAPIFAEAAEKYTGTVKFAKLDVDQNPAIAGTLGVRGIPTLILFKAGKAVATQVGLLSKADLMKFIDKHIV